MRALKACRGLRAWRARKETHGTEEAPNCPAARPPVADQPEEERRAIRHIWVRENWMQVAGHTTNSCSTIREFCERLADARELEVKAGFEQAARDYSPAFDDEFGFGSEEESANFEHPIGGRQSKRRAANAPERPATYTIPAAADLLKVAQASTIVTVLSDLSGGDKAKMTWLAICGAEFPEVVGKIIDVQKSDAYVDFMVYFGATQEDVEAATTANMDVKVWTAAQPANAASGITPQPDVVRLQKDDPIRFAGTLASYDPSPFLLHWDKVKVDPTIIPDKGAPAKHAAPRKPAAKPGI